MSWGVGGRVGASWGGGGSRVGASCLGIMNLSRGNMSRDRVLFPHKWSKGSRPYELDRARPSGEAFCVLDSLIHRWDRTPCAKGTLTYATATPVLPSIPFKWTYIVIPIGKKRRTINSP